jgi:hypothetical protein
MRPSGGAIAAFLVGVYLVSASCGDARGIDRLRYKQVKVGFRLVLVDRFSEKVAYYLSDNKWVKFLPQSRTAVQALYDYQRQRRPDPTQSPAK